MAVLKAPWTMWSVAALLHSIHTATSMQVQMDPFVETESMLEVIVHAPGGGNVHTIGSNSTQRQKGLGKYSTSSLADDSPHCLTCGRMAYQYVTSAANATAAHSFPSVSFPDPGGGAIVTHFSVRAQGDICGMGVLTLTLAGVTATSSSCQSGAPCQCNSNYCVSCTATSSQHLSGIPGWAWGTHALQPSFSGAGMAIESLVIDIFYITVTPSPTPSPTPYPTYPAAPPDVPMGMQAPPDVPMGMQAAGDPMAAGISGAAPLAAGVSGAAGGPGVSGAAAATGDPHLQNVFGERFDLMRPGNHVLIHIPREERVENALFRVEAVARQLGRQCTDMYFQEINVTGDWVEKKYHRGGAGLRFQARRAHDETPGWIKLGEVQVKVTHGRTQKGTDYLNFHVKDLGRTGFVVGGLLGADDHTEATMPSKDCVHHLSLLQTAVRSNPIAPVFSIAEASFA